MILFIKIIWNCVWQSNSNIYILFASFSISFNSLVAVLTTVLPIRYIVFCHLSSFFANFNSVFAGKSHTLNHPSACFDSICYMFVRLSASYIYFLVRQLVQLYRESVRFFHKIKAFVSGLRTTVRKIIAVYAYGNPH